MKRGYQIVCKTRREDPDDWTCQIVHYGEYIVDNKTYTDKTEVEKRFSELHDHVESLGLFDMIEKHYELRTIILESD